VENEKEPAFWLSAKGLTFSDSVTEAIRLAMFAASRAEHEEVRLENLIEAMTSVDEFRRALFTSSGKTPRLALEATETESRVGEMSLPVRRVFGSVIRQVRSKKRKMVTLHDILGDPTDLHKLGLAGTTGLRRARLFAQRMGRGPQPQP
jgi:hypothetical protein